MKNRNVVVAFLVVFSLICAYYLFFSWRAQTLEGDLDAMSAKDKAEWLKDPENVKTLKHARENSFTLGLDLQGGMYVTLEVEVEAVLKGLANNTKEPKFNKALVNARKRKVESQDAFVDLFVEEIKKIDPNVNLATYFANPTSGIKLTSSENEVISFLNKEADDAVERTFNIIRTRIDQFGVASPNIQLIGNTGRILLELPGVKEPERVRKLLKGTAELAFWTTYTNEETIPYLNKINKRVQEIEGIEVTDDSTSNDTTTNTSQGDSLSNGNQDSLNTKTEDQDTGISTDDIIKGGGNNKGGNSGQDTSKIDEEKWKKENPFFAVFSPPNYQAMQNQEQLDAELKSPRMGFANATDTAQITKWLSDPIVHQDMPDDIKFMWSAKPVEEGSEVYALIAIRSNFDGRPPLGGEQITDAKLDFDPQSNQPVVSMKMNAEGAKVWKKLTGDNIGKSIAIVLDNRVYSYPTVNGVIPNGSSQIAGGFTVDEAKDLANLLKAGKLPAPARIEGEEIVGPSLGQEAIDKGLFSFFAAFFATVIFMFFYYRGSGVIADLALLANLFFIMGVSASFQVVLTLPGIAAIVLTMGMAVDANVLIFERIREELNAGKKLKAAITDGFKNALSTVLDSNITTFLTGIVLFSFGVGPIRGFAVSLMIGIVTSLIAALFLSRLIINIYVNRKGSKPLAFGVASITKFFDSIDLKFDKKRKMAYIISGALVLGSLASIFTVGFKQGVDFQGGRQYIVEFESAPDVEKVRTDLTAAFGGNAPVIKTIGDKNQVLITTNYLIQSANKDATEKVTKALTDGLAKNFAKLKPEVVKATTVGPTVANDVKYSAILSIVFSLLIIFLYILLRFRRWQFSLGALAAIFHDVIIVLGVFSLFGYLDFLPFALEIDQAFIAAVLTIIGYSINDTVVVFDRIREELADVKKQSLPTVFGIAINQTLSRTLITAVTTLITILILLIFGGTVIKGFMLALLVGIVVGTYSSIFIASPISLDLITKSTKDIEEVTQKLAKQKRNQAKK